MPGCRLRVPPSGRPRYPSDMTDAEWEVLGPLGAGAVDGLRGCGTAQGGRPMAHRLRVVVDAIRYLVRYGVEWRALPADFPPWQAVYAFFERWAVRGLPQRIVDRLRGQLRVGAGRAELPTAAVIDSQSVKAADTVGAATSGFDSGKKIKGRKRHAAVDSNGWLLAVLVTAASVQDRDGGHRLVALLRERFSTITLVWADGGYAGRLVAWAAAVLAVTVTVVKRSDNLRGFVVLPRRWVVERTFGWLNRHRRLVRDYERRPEHHEAMVLGHHHDHDKAVGPPAQWGPAPPALGRRTQRAAARPERSTSGMKPFTNRLLAVFTGAGPRRRRCGCRSNRTARRRACSRQRTCVGRRSRPNPHRNQQVRPAAASARSRPNRPAVVAGSKADADGDQVRIGGVAVDAVSAGEGLDAHRGARRNPRPGRLAPGVLPHAVAPRPC